MTQLAQIASSADDVASIALKVGKSAGYVYGRLRFVDLIEDAAKAFLENRLTAGHALLIARLPQTQQSQALDAAFRSHWGSTEKQVVPVRELAQWIRQQLMLQLDDAIFDREDGTLIPEAGSCVQCPKRTGFNTALFDDFQNDDRCLDSGCYESKVTAWLKRQTEQNPALVQVSEYWGQQKDQPVIQRGQYVEIKPRENAEEPQKPAEVVCESAATGIVVEGQHLGKTIQICANPECPVHHAPRRKQRRNATRNMNAPPKRAGRTLADNQALLDSVLSKAPAVLTRADHEMIIAAWLDVLEYEDSERLCERHQIDVAEVEAEDDYRSTFAKPVAGLSDAGVVRFLIELALIQSGYSSTPLDDADPLRVAAQRNVKPAKQRVSEYDDPIQRYGHRQLAGLHVAAPLPLRTVRHDSDLRRLYRHFLYSGRQLRGDCARRVDSGPVEQSHSAGHLFTQIVGLCAAAPFLFVLGWTRSHVLLVAALLVFGLGRGLYDCNAMPVLCQIARPEYRATGYGIFNCAACLSGGVAAALAGYLKNAIGLNMAFQAAAVLLLLSSLLLYRVRVVSDDPGSFATNESASAVTHNGSTVAEDHVA